MSDLIALSLAEKLRDALSQTQIKFRETIVPVTASFGVTTLKNKNFRTPEEMFVLADETMFRVKEKGKNGVMGDEKAD